MRIRNYPLIFCVLSSMLLSPVFLPAAQSDSQLFHNVIVLIPDGCGVAHMTMARWFKGAPLAQDDMDISLVHTHNTNSMITGSAAAATAFATGYKTWEGPDKARCVSMRPDSLILPKPYKLPESQQWRPVASVLEGARLAGKAVGLVATCRVSHATPAAYASHWHARNDEHILMEQMVYAGIDVVFGGGLAYLIDTDSKIPGTTLAGRRDDGENLYDVLIARGYDIITTKDELDGLPPEARKVWGMFAPSHMYHDIDRHRVAPDQPSLVEMTRQAIRVLSQNPNGFFLTVEGSQVDWSSHTNDPVGTITEYIAFDQVVTAALEFARSSREPTLVLVFPDHDNGGMSLGDRDADYGSFQPVHMVNVINRAALTSDAAAWLVYTNTDNAQPDPDTVRDIISEYYGITDLTADELGTIMADLKDTLTDDLPRLLGHMLSRRAHIGWTTFGHTGNDVPMFSYGLKDVPQTIENTDIAHLCARSMGFNLESVNERLIVDAEMFFDRATVTIDTINVLSSAGQLIVEQDDKIAFFPFFKNIMVMDQDTLLFEGLTLYSLNAHRAYLPKQAKKLFDIR
ncbi:MAG: alkaline phosphatase [candidate division WOR-3 bacterium]|nr:MAG: alkaline phosphatase [candidate division WOR-3 bacterium]